MPKKLETATNIKLDESGVSRLAKARATVALHYSHSAEGAESAVEEIRSIGGIAAAFQADFRQLETLTGLVDQAADFLGGIDILVNNAGITSTTPFEEFSDAQFETLFNVNVRAQFFLTKAVVPGMANRTIYFFAWQPFLVANKLHDNAIPDNPNS